MSYFSGIYLDAQRVQKGRKSDIFYRFVCAYCYKHIPVPLQCAACRSVKYCSRDCQKKAWKGQGCYRGGHKEECAEIKGYMKEFGEVQAIVKQFPWAILSEKEGLFNYELGLAMHKVLGSGPKFGFWALEPPDLNVDSVVKKTLGVNRPLSCDTWGRILLSNKNYDEESGWKLPAEHTPWLTFSKGRRAPSFPPAFEQNWTSYYEWRGLPLKSPAALLLHWPLSIYRLLYLLGFVHTDPTGGTERRKLTIHWLGVEVETNFLPIFGELALLFPNTDIDIIAFGQYPYDRAREAKPSALAAREYVYEYRAPEQCGSGSIRIQLYKTSPIWDPVDILSRKMIPDVLIGLNAGMSTYETWQPVFLASRALSIPFAITEFARVSLAEDEYHYPSWIVSLQSNTALVELLGLEKLKVLLESIDHPPSSAINPFMRPGPIAAMTNSMPRAINGFTCIVTPRVETQE